MSKKKQTGLEKDQYTTFKDQINVVNKNRKDPNKTEDGRIIDNKYISQKIY